jgi:tetratricopeptide (TPR) repeat protein
MSEFLTAGTYEEKGILKTNRYHTPPKQAHLNIIRNYMANFQGNWQDCDPYGLRRLVCHMKACLDLEQEVRSRNEQLEVIFSVVLDERFQQAQWDKIGDPQVMLADLWTAFSLALQVGDHNKALEVINRAWAVAETLFEDAKALTLIRVAQALEEIGDLKKATEAANQALEVAKTIQYEGVKALALRMVSPSLFLVGEQKEIDRAMVVVNTIQDERARTEALSAVTQALAKLGHQEKLEELKDTAHWAWGQAGQFLEKGIKVITKKFQYTVPGVKGESDKGDEENK